MRLTVEQLDEGLARIEGLRKKEAEAPDSEPAVFALVIDGKSLTFALDSQNKDKFLELAQACAAVIACRVSPKQKALVSPPCCVSPSPTSGCPPYALIPRCYWRSVRAKDVTELRRFAASVNWP
jgi:hypothetical protein